MTQLCVFVFVKFDFLLHSRGCRMPELMEADRQLGVLSHAHYDVNAPVVGWELLRLYTDCCETLQWFPVLLCPSVTLTTTLDLQKRVNSVIVPLYRSLAGICCNTHLASLSFLRTPLHSHPSPQPSIIHTIPSPTYLPTSNDLTQ